MLVFLVGFMGSGKTTIGLEIAKALDIDFFDMDELIQDQQAMTISEIFRNYGQDYFRALERDMIRDFGQSFDGDVVIATGGGAPCFFDNIEQMNQIGTTVYLNLQPATLLERLEGEADGRPLIAGKTSEEMLDLINKMHEQRAPYYEKSSYVVDGNRTPDTIVEHILYLLNE